jgi:uncharacterized protein (TIGR02265 family)
VCDARTSVRPVEPLYRLLVAKNPALAEGLRASGFDPEWPLRDYPSAVWLACLEYARAGLFPDLAPADGMRRLGETMSAVIRSTLLAQIDSSARTAEEYIRRLPRLVTLARPDVEAEAIYQSDGCWALSVHGASLNGYYMAGLLEATLRARGHGVRAEVALSHERGYRLRLIVESAPAIAAI